MPIALPFVTRREIAREYRPDGTVSDEAAIRTLRGKKSLSDGISIASRLQKGRLGGRAHLYSALNREAARAARRHDVKLAVRIAKAARGLESAPEAKRLTSFLIETVALTNAAELAKALSDPSVLADVEALQIKQAKAVRTLNLTAPTLLTGHVAWFSQVGALLDLEGLPGQISIPRVVIDEAGLGSIGAAVAATWEILPGGRTLMTVEPAVDTATGTADVEPMVDLYGTPWGMVLAGADPATLLVTGTPTVTIPAGIPDVE